MRRSLKSPDPLLAVVEIVDSVVVTVVVATDVPDIKKTLTGRRFVVNSEFVNSWLFYLLKLGFKAAFFSSSIFLAVVLLTNYLGPLKLSLNTRNIDQKNLFSVDGGGETQVQPGQIDLKVSVSLDYETL